MYIKYTDLDNPVVIHLPENTDWILSTSDVSPDGYEEYTLCLEYDNNRYFIRDTDVWSSARPALRDEEVHKLYKEIVEIVSQMLAENSDLKVIDIDAIEESIFPKYVKLWSEKGYITVDENGNW